MALAMKLSIQKENGAPAGRHFPCWLAQRHATQSNTLATLNISNQQGLSTGLTTKKLVPPAGFEPATNT